MIGTPAGFIVRALLAALIFTGAIGALGVVLPATAGAYATIEGPPVFSTAPGLPDGRVYELVSPASKNGNEAGATTNPFITGAAQRYGYAAPDGNSVLFEGTGPMGESPSPDSVLFVAQRSTTGWSTRALEPAARQEGRSVGTLRAQSDYVDPSPDLSHAMVLAGNYALAPEPNVPCKGELQLYLTGPDPFVPATWLEQPAIPDLVESCASYLSSEAPVGGTPDFSTVYFTYGGTLLPEDASRAPHTQRHGSADGDEAWGFYEYREGVLHEAGVLPDGGLDPFGAVPAASGHGKALAGNEVSADGSRAFFVSPDPDSCEQNGSPFPGQNDCALDPPELYVRENGSGTQLVSKDTLLPEVGGLPASAPDGVLRMPNPTFNSGPQIDGSEVFASPDGSHAFFQSEDKLTPEAPEGPPGNTSPKTYDFDVETGALTYLPNVVGEIVATDADGSSFAFVRPEAGGQPAELDLWSAGPSGGVVAPITPLPESVSVSEGRMSSDGSVVVFETGSRLSSTFNSGGVIQVYRYDVPANTLGCVSCPPHGVTPSGNASISSLQPDETYEHNAPNVHGVVDSRGISSDGDRIFFDSPDPLVPQDANTNSPEVEVEEATFAKQGRDVYEWENGVVYLISGGKSPRNSLLLGNSENGDDVFFATAESLVPGDTDGGYDVYDARVPHPGDNPPAAAVPCEGSVCQGPPRVPSPLAAPSSATFSGLGNVAPEPMSAPVVKSKATPKAKKCGKGVRHECKKKPKTKHKSARKAARRKSRRS